MGAIASCHYEHYIHRREELAKVIKQQLSVLENLGLSREEDRTRVENLRTVAGCVAIEDLKVLIMGTFNAGKSTLINAMLGEKILPAKMLPATAIINEIRFSEDADKRIIVYPKAGRWKGGDAPFRIDLHELETYVTIDHSGSPGRPKDSPFDKVEIFWPLPLCANKIQLVDSPGLNDPDSHDKITLQYLPHTDAIVYCMDSEHACSRVDMEAIAMLHNYGYTSILFLLTKFDRVRETARRNRTTEDKELVEVITAQLEGFTEVGRRGIFFVDSQAALTAKKDRNAGLLRASGFAQMERDLEEYLVLSRFRAKFVRAIGQIRTTNLDAQSTIDNRLKMADTSLAELEDRFNRAQAPLDRLKLQSQLIFGQIENGMLGLSRAASDQARAFFSAVPAKVPGWADQFEPASSVSLIPGKIKASVEALADDYLAHLKHKLELEASTWAAEELVPWINGQLTSLFKNVDVLTRDYNKTLRTIRVQLDFKRQGEAIAAEQDPSMASKLGGIIYGLVTHDWLNAGMVSVFGVKGLVRGLVTQLVAAVVLAIVSLFHPIGSAALLTALVSAAVAATTLDYFSLKAKVKAKVIESVKNTLQDSGEQSKMVKSIETQVGNEFKQIVASMREAAREDLNSVESDVEKALQIKREGQAKVAKERDCLTSTSEVNKQVSKAVFDLAIEAKSEGSAR